MLVENDISAMKHFSFKSTGVGTKGAGGARAPWSKFKGGGGGGEGSGRV